MKCSTCRGQLEIGWKLCPFCGTRVTSASATRGLAPDSSPKVVWSLWSRYRVHVEEGLQPFADAISSVPEGDLGALVRVWTPGRQADALANAMRGLGKLGSEPDLPPSFRRALVELGGFHSHAVRIVDVLAPAAADYQAAVQALIDAGEIDPTVVNAVVVYVKRIDFALTFGQVASAITGFHSGLLYLIGQGLSGWFQKLKSDSRRELLQDSLARLTESSNQVIDRGWDFMAHMCREQGLRLPTAAAFHRVEERARVIVEELCSQRMSIDGSFERALARSHALANHHRDGWQVHMADKIADLLAESRKHALGSFMSPLYFSISDVTVIGARQHFLRLLSGDVVLTFISTTVFNYGRYGLALTTSSLQWNVEGQAPLRLGYAHISIDSIGWRGTSLFIAGRTLELDTENEAMLAAGVVRGCVQVLKVRPGPPACKCGAPGQWLEFGADSARCSSCRRTVRYA